VTLAANAAQLQAEARAQVHFFQSHSALLPVQIQAWLQQQVQMRLSLAQQQQSQFFQLKQQHDGATVAGSVPLADSSSITLSDPEPAPTLADPESLQDLHQRSPQSASPASASLPVSALALSSSNVESSSSFAGLAPKSSTGTMLPPLLAASISLPQIPAAEAELELVATSTLTSTKPALGHEVSRLDDDSVVLEQHSAGSGPLSSTTSPQLTQGEAFASHLATHSPRHSPSFSSSLAFAETSMPVPLQHPIISTSVSDPVPISSSRSVEVPLAAEALNIPEATSPGSPSSVSESFEPVFEAMSTE
jgi:hypothetical protein